MTEAQFRRRLFFGGGTFVLFLAVLGMIFWRAMPPIVPEHMEHRERPFSPVADLPTAFTPARAPGVRYAVVREQENVRITPSGFYDGAIKLWETWLSDFGAQRVPPRDADVLIIPEARCLSPLSRRLIQEHLNKGGGLVTTGPMGAYDGICRPLKDTLLVALIGGQQNKKVVAKAPRRGTESFYGVILGETVLGANLPPGARYEMRPQDQIVFWNNARELFYSDYERHPLRVGEPFFDGAAARALIGKGRIVAFGFSFQTLVDEWSKQLGKHVAANAVWWAAGKPMYQVAPWPHGKLAAAVLAQDVEADFVNAREVLDRLAKFKLPGTAFIVGDLAQQDPETTSRLVKMMEIGTHTQRHLPLDTLPPAEQLKELDYAKRVAEQLSGRPVTGLRPPEERFDVQTLQMWADLGGDYFFGSNNTRVAAPEIIPLLPDSLIMLGRVSEDDFEILSRDGIRDRRQMADRLIQQVSEIVAYRGLYMFSYHSHMFAQKDLLPVLEALAEKLQNTPTVWTATAGDIATWWRRRAALKMEPFPDGRVRITNKNDVPLEGVVIVVDLPDGKRRKVRLPLLQAGASMILNER
ncbi:MAG TPA: polysaccharide deacetylase family protein [Longimicrobiales bacterium]|nr:polysaccharide deacetylase family protein [Longimicrobiales bacterium]